MKNNTINKLLLFVFSLFMISATQSSWEEFVSQEGDFRVLVPGQMMEKTKSIPTEIGTLEYHTFIYNSNDENAENVFYMVSYCDYPEGAMHSDSVALVKEFFETTVTSAVESVDGDLAYSTDITMNDYPGKLWRINYNGGTATIKSKAFLVENRFYSLPNRRP